MLVVLDVTRHVDAREVCCPNPACTAKGTAFRGAPIKDKGWHSNAHSCKGDGDAGKVYVASKTRQCK